MNVQAKLPVYYKVKRSAKVRNTFLSISMLFIIATYGCGKDGNNPTSTLPYVQVDRTLDLNNAQYQNLSQPGSFVYLDNEGSKGILVYRGFGDDFYALDRHCAYQQNNACARVSMDKSRTFIRCGAYTSATTFDTCCTTIYSTDGGYQAGPDPNVRLLRYRSTFENNAVHITN